MERVVTGKCAQPASLDFASYAMIIVAASARPNPTSSSSPRFNNELKGNLFLPDLIEICLCSTNCLGKSAVYGNADKGATYPERQGHQQYLHYSGCIGFVSFCGFWISFTSQQLYGKFSMRLRILNNLTMCWQWCWAIDGYEEKIRVRPLMVVTFACAFVYAL
ncbi:hypothetical protein ACSBR1_022139 [Camellia fascicularis]